MNNRLTLAVLPRTQRGTPIVLDASPDGQNFLYCHGHSVVIRSLDSPQVADIYTQHATDTLVAKYSPSGFYIASADKSGKIRIWDTVNKEHILKNEYQPISGPIKDLAWSPDNQRIVCVGDGREKFGHVFLAETGTSNGDITGQSRPVNSCDFRPARPFRIITGSEDNTAAFYEGPPFKFKGSKNDHSRYCQVVRYSPDGKVWASGGFDGKVFLYDGVSSDALGEFTGDGGKAAHAGGVYALAFSPDGAKVLTASGDKTCKIWDVEGKTAVASYSAGDDVEDQMLGCLWSKRDQLLAVSLSGNIHFLDPRTPGGIVMDVIGHNKPITALARRPTDDETDKTLVTGDSDGRVVIWQTERGSATQLNGRGPTNQINGIAALSDGRRLLVAGIDDTLRAVDSGEYVSASAKLPAQPKGVVAIGEDGLAAVATIKAMLLVDGANVKLTKAVDYEPSCVAYCSQSGHLAVGDGANNSTDVHIHDAKTLEPVAKAKATGFVTCVAFSPDGKYLAVGDANRRITLLAVGSYEKAHAKEWGFHSARVTCLGWSPDSTMLASGGLDCAVILWSPEQPSKHHVMAGAHLQSQINGLAWVDKSTVATTGQDGNLKIWNVTWKP